MDNNLIFNLMSGVHLTNTAYSGEASKGMSKGMTPKILN
jgi:hypothetical protein